MSEIYEQIMQHRCIRKFTDEPIDPAHLEMITEAAIHAPTSANGQQLAMVVLTDPQRREALAHLCSEQMWMAKAPAIIVFVADFSIIARTLAARGEEFGVINSLDATMMGAVDCGLALGNSINVAQSLGYGIVPIGAIRSHPEAVIEMLELPRYSFPVVGLCVGHPAHTSAVKPRLGRDRFVHAETYRELPEAAIDAYDEVIHDYLVERTGDPDSPAWSDGAVLKYRRAYHPRVAPTLKSQGFDFN